MPRTGADGAGAATDDGIFFVNATYMGQAVTATVIEFDINGKANHPYAVDNTGTPLEITGTPGDDLVVLQLPFGSFTQAQPPATVTVNVDLSNLADVDTPLSISASGGFQFGKDPLDNPATDPSIVGTPTSSTLTPTLLTLTKTYVDLEDETATGPNFPRQYLITVNVADGQTLTDLDLTDVLPDNLQFVQVETAIRGVSTATTAISTPSTSSPGGTLTRRFASITGTTAADDATMLFTFYVPRDNLAGSRVILPHTGDDVTSVDDAKTQAIWDPIDSRDPAATVSSDVTPADHTLFDKSIAIQKGVSNVIDVAPTGNTPGDTLEYTLGFQLSDFFAFQGLVITDTFSDGQRWSTIFTPTLLINGNTIDLVAADFSAGNYTVDISQIGNDTNPATDGSTTVHFRVSDEMIARGLDGKLIGGCIPVGGTGGPGPDCGVYNNGPTSGIIKFRTVIQDAYSDTYPSGDPSLNENDGLSNSVVLGGALLSETDTAVLNGTVEADGSSAGVTIAKGVLAKSVYAVNGNTGADPTKLAPGDEVTYRLRYDLAFGDFEQFTMTDYVPLPVFHVGDPDDDGTPGPAWSFDSTGATTPPTGQWKRGPADTQFARSAVVLGSGIMPTTTVDDSANSIRFDYGTFADPGNVPTTIDLLFTITTSDDPFADGLFLTNQVRQTDQNTENVAPKRDAIVRVELTQPVITEITKGVIATDNSTSASFQPATVGPVAFTPPGSLGARWVGAITSDSLATTPIDSNLSGVDAGDLVSFAIVIENIGSGLNGAFDVQIKDTLPAGFVLPVGGLNLSVTDGTGAGIGHTNVGGGSGLMDQGIELADPGPTAIPTGGLDTYSGTSGRNIAIITYDLQVDSGVAPAGQVVNTATLLHFAGKEGAPNHLTGPLTDSATVTIKSPVIGKTITGTNQAHTSGNAVAIGEIITYSVAITVPEGTSTNAKLVDVMDTGLVFVDCLGITASPNVTTDVPGGYGAVCSGGSVTGQGATITFDLGTITNSNSDNAIADVVTVTYRAVVINGGSNDRGDQRNNSATWSWDTGTLGVSAPNVTIVEPTLLVAKSASPTTGDAGDEITYQIVISHAPSSNADAFNVVLSDTLPANLTYVGGSLVVLSGAVPDSGPTITAGLIAASWDAFPHGATTTIQVKATLGAVRPNEVITNRADITYTSLPGDVTTPQTPNSNVSTERTGITTDPGGTDNDYAATSSRAVTVKNVTLAKSLVATSEAGTAGSALAIGEIVRYRLAVAIPEGVLPNFQMRDVLPTGLTFLDDGTAKVAFVTNGAGIASSTINSGLPSCANLTLSGNSGAVTPTCPLPDSGVSSSTSSDVDTYNSGTDPYFKMGDIVNSDSDGDNEYIVVEFNALADNSSGGSNDAGDSRNNSFRVMVGGTQVGPNSNTVAVSIVEPVINNLDKAVTLLPSDALDTVSYRVVFTNTGTAVAYDVALVDTLPADLTLDTGSVVVTLNAGAAGSTDNSSGNTVSVTVDAIPVGGGVTVVYSATLNLSVTPGQQIDNSGTIVYSSLPGSGSGANPTGSNTPGASGATNGERNGSGGLNDYRDSDLSSFTVALPTLTKSIVATSESHTSSGDLAIGEVVRYRIEATLPEGTANGVTLVDTLPNGLSLLDLGQVRLSFVADTAFTAAGDLSGADNDAVPPTFVLPSGRISTVNQVITFDLGNLINNDSDANAERIVLEFNALVQNVSGNNRGDSKVNSFKMTINGVDRGTAASTTAWIVEPMIANLDKVVTLAPTDAGDPVVYRVSYSNTGNATAFEVRLLDVLPAGVTLQLPLTITLAGGATGLTDNSVANTVDMTVAQMPASSSVTVQVAATVNASVAPQQVIDNTAAITYSSLPGVGSSGNPTGSNTPGGSGAATGERDGSGGINDHNDSDLVSLSLAAPGIVKQLAGTSAAHTSGPAVTIGEVITYALTITLPEGVSPSLVITDGLPAGLAYVASSLTVDSTGFGGSLPAPSVTTAGGSGDDVMVTFGSITVTADNNASNNSFTVRLRALVVDVPGNVGINLPGQTILSNTAALRVASNAEVNATPVVVNVVEPHLAITKTFIPAQAAANDTITVELRVQNTGLSDAFDVIIEDPLASITYTNVSEAGTPAGFSFSAVPGPPNVVVGYTGATIPVGALRIFTLTAKLAAHVGFGDIYTNIATVTQATTLPGVDTNERDEPDVSGSDTLTIIAPDLTLTKSDGRSVLEPGQTTVYTLTVENVGTREATGVVLTDTVPLGVIFNAAASSIGWSCPDGSLAGTVCTFNMGNLAVSNVVPVLFGVTVDIPEGSGITTVVNTANVADDGTHGVDPTPANNSDSDSQPYLTASIGDFVWYDTDGDGVQDGGEPGIPSVVISLTNSVGSVMTRTTDASGVYSFSNLVSGAYTVTVGSGVPASATATSGAESQISPYAFNLGVGQNFMTADFGYDLTPAYVISKVLLTGQPARTREVVSFRIAITNTGAGLIDFLPLADTYNEVLLRYTSASTPPDNSASDGALNWADLTTTLGDIAPGGVISLTVNFESLRDTTVLPGGNTTNTATASGATVDPDGAGPLGSVESLPPAADGATVIILGPTAVTLAESHVVRLENGGVQIDWRTVSEAEIVGFHLLRRGVDGAVIALTETPILAQNPGQAIGGVYSFVDTRADGNGADLYLLQIIFADGRTQDQELGVAAGPWRIFLPLVGR